MTTQQRQVVVDLGISVAFVVLMVYAIAFREPVRVHAPENVYIERAPAPTEDVAVGEPEPTTLRPAEGAATESIVPLGKEYRSDRFGVTLRYPTRLAIVHTSESIDADSVRFVKVEDVLSLGRETESPADITVSVSRNSNRLDALAWAKQLDKGTSNGEIGAYRVEHFSGVDVVRNHEEGMGTFERAVLVRPSDHAVFVVGMWRYSDNDPLRGDFPILLAQLVYAAANP